MVSFQWLVHYPREPFWTRGSGMVVLIQLQRFLSSGKTCQSERQVPKHRKTKLFSQNPKQMRLVKGYWFFSSTIFSPDMISGNLKAPSVFLVWNKIKRLFSKARRFHRVWSWKTAACLLQAAEIPRHSPSSRIRGEWGKPCSKILRRRDGGETWGRRMVESQDTRGFGLSKISKCLADMTCKTTVPPKSLLKESVPRWSSRYAWSGEAGQGELWPYWPWQLEVGQMKGE